MSRTTHQDLGSPVSPVRPESFPYHHHLPTTASSTRAHSHAHSHPQHQHQHHSEPTVSPLTTEYPDSPTLGHLSPISIVSPIEPLPLSFNPTPSAAKSRFPLPQRQIAASLEPVPQTVQLARGGTVHMQDFVPFKAATSRERGEIEGAGADVGSLRPGTMYLADHSPYVVAEAPTARVAGPRYGDGVGGREGGSGGVQYQDVELQEVETRAEGRGSGGDYQAQSSHVRNPGGGHGSGLGFGGKKRVRTLEEVERRKRHCIIGWVFLLALIVVGAVFAVLIIQAHKPGGVAG